MYRDRSMHCVETGPYSVVETGLYSVVETGPFLLCFTLANLDPPYRVWSIDIRSTFES